MNKTFKKYLIIYAVLFPIVTMQYLGYSEILKSYELVRGILSCLGSLTAGIFITFGILWLRENI